MQRKRYQLYMSRNTEPWQRPRRYVSVKFSICHSVYVSKTVTVAQPTALEAGSIPRVLTYPDNIQEVSHIDTCIMVSRALTHFCTPQLRQKSLPVEVFDDKLKALADNLFKAMYHDDGIGISAPQVC